MNKAIERSYAYARRLAKLGEYHPTATTDFRNGYEKALRDIETVVRQYEKKGSRMMDESGEAGEQGGYTFWDGFHNCASNILRELK